MSLCASRIAAAKETRPHHTWGFSYTGSWSTKEESAAAGTHRLSSLQGESKKKNLLFL